jgi:hypothetical protein
MQAAYRRRSLLEVLGSVPDPRGRQGRRYPIGSLLAVMLAFQPRVVARRVSLPVRNRDSHQSTLVLVTFMVQGS